MVDFCENVVPRNQISHGHFSLNDMFYHDRMTHATVPLIFYRTGGGTVKWWHPESHATVPPFHHRNFLIVMFLRTVPNGPKSMVAWWNLVEWWHGYSRATFNPCYFFGMACIAWLFLVALGVCHDSSHRFWTNQLHHDHCISLCGFHIMCHHDANDGSFCIFSALKTHDTL
jgi:hypothetical protein